MPVLIAAALLLAADPAPADPARAGDAAAKAPAVRSVAGKLSEVNLAERRVLLEAVDGPVVLTLDRNTSIYLEARLGTVRDLAVGVPARASLGPGGEAHWIEMRPRGMQPTRATELAPATANAPGSSTPAPAPTSTPTPTPTATPTATPTSNSTSTSTPEAKP